MGEQVIADVTWSAGTPVGMAACATRVVASDGTVSVHTGTLGAGEGRDLSAMTLGHPYSGASATIRCEPYESPEQSDPSHWLPWVSD